MSLKFLTELSDDYKNLFESEFGYDVIIYAGEEPNIKEIHAHSNILCIRSQYFRSAFSNEWAEKKDGKFIFKKPNISPHLLDIILRFIYYGNIELNNLQGTDVLKLLIAVDELNIQSLITYIQEFLIKHQTEFLNQNPSGVLETVYHHEAFTDLWDFFLEEICKEPKILFNSDNFVNLKAPLLELLLKRDDLDIEEVEIWENLLRWCFNQQNIENDPKKWNKDDIIKIERSLHRYVPLIRFYDIEPADFFYKVYRYKDVLPLDLINDLLEFHIVPNMKPKTDITPSRRLCLKVDSTLIEPKHITLFASWIDRKDSSNYYNLKNNPYYFKLLHSSNQDGFNTESFHNNCDNKGATIWVAKIQGSTQLIGGYNPLDWEGNKWKTTSDSFIFNFTDIKNNSTVKYLGYVNQKLFAVYCGNEYGPKMGYLNSYSSKNWTNNNNNNGSHIYPNIGIPDKFTVENYEVFQVVKKKK
ncbi:hypothetical protein GLOIN_2v1868612 [Rhizophagus irregularis DAOM 181602=DAOM 197198]|uniref:Btb/poz domain-containing protein 19-like n=2 Tax=Rhizophagus irregularis TaxID=588596 RepID=A0A015M0U3_RHIIW|nr:hypothetical protein GLOIN_2v1868612 [Rhizophagus irregularis DAOM 181602=DAOM 197198]EXX78586.1 hypothetical protein RirG_013720 [Rhizophagus irregularis DAOM 197198w]POG80944.1 hypothetical protein GLOIN_2v1868612 [Rhizophagus irregularis DAOM 181602=DAOM 197198]|eukprot:XP_025187810.1 hypothetical protein GLOIN_2v1868612 [Rhizophagus irregularis DAOM 181602=DAOM 197198]